MKTIIKTYSYQGSKCKYYIYLSFSRYILYITAKLTEIIREESYSGQSLFNTLYNNLSI